MSIQPFYLTISEDFQHTYSFDKAGRFTVGFFEGINYQRSLSNTILQKAQTRESPRSRHVLSAEESQHLIDDIRGRVQRICDSVPAEELAGITPWLQRILDWDFARLQEQKAVFDTVYKPINVLPPDQYLAVVLQATEGCSWNQCTFCSFYRDRRFRIKTVDEFREHVQQVKALLGSAIGQRKSLFLSDANALIIPQPRLIELLEVLHEAFPIGEPRAGYDYLLKGIYSFLDIFGAECKTLDDYRELYRYGVRRIYIGLETGDREVFALLNKPGSPQDCIDVVRTIKTAGIDVGVILLAGAGGDRFAGQHLQNSIRTLAEMGLGAGDIVYLSPLVLAGEEEYSQRLRDLGAYPLSHAEMMRQVDAIKATFKLMGSNRPRVTLYDIQEFIY